MATHKKYLTEEDDDRLELCWKDCVWNENWEEFEMVKNVANIIFD